ncbi:MAG TPA: 5'-3' exonuclease H3TH domain-containing protein, partial [Steroidobacteraceae bacterium]|nr:5'-3' exonuclease H3TH domain-containing protein [Steroidobacteraceae bacterium]
RAVGSNSDELAGSPPTGRLPDYRKTLSASRRYLTCHTAEGLAEAVCRTCLQEDFPAIERHFGVAPERFADYLALTGDDCDNIPGVPGVGHKTASSLMKAFDSLDDLYANLPRVLGLKLRGARTLSDRLREHRESVFLARKLTHITCDMQLGVDVEGLRRRRPDAPALTDLYDRLGFGPFLRRQGERLAQIPMS